ncbi:MAG: hypothetical protein U0359_12485 [Byssovorax sp.]
MLERVVPAVPRLGKIMSFLADCDLVKFARVVPDEDDCVDARKRGEKIVRSTMPRMATEKKNKAGKGDRVDRDEREDRDDDGEQGPPGGSSGSSEPAGSAGSTDAGDAPGTEEASS